MSFGFSVGDFLGVIEKIHHIRKVFVGAPAQFRFLHDELRTLSIVIMDVDTQSPNDCQKEKLKHIVKQCNNVITDIRNTIERYQEIDDHHSLERPWKRLKLDPKDVKELRDRVHGIVKSLDVINGQITQGNVQELVKYKNDEQQQKYLEWLSPASYATGPYENALDLRQPGTGKWFIESSEFQNWAAVPGETLFCPGIPGAGKTILSSIVIHDLKSRYGNDSKVGIAYIFCSFNYFEHQRQRQVCLLASVLRQLLQGMPEIPDVVVAMYERNKNSESRPSLHEISEALKVTVSLLLSRTFIVIDALDECKYSTISSILRQVVELQANSNLNLLATSRQIPEIQAKFWGVPNRGIYAANEDVEHYLESRLADSDCFLSRRPQLCKKVITSITQSTKGMFLLAQLYLKSFMSMVTSKEILAEVEIISLTKNSADGNSSNINDAFDTTMDRICQQVRQEKLAKDALSWIIHAQRPLTTLELRTALGVEVGQLNADEDSLPDIEDIITSCAGLVVIEPNEGTGVVQLAHYTIHEYFMRFQGWPFPTAHRVIADKCLTYLSFDAFAHGMCSDDIEYEARLNQYPLYSYAAQNWGYHARTQSVNDDLLYSFLKKTPNYEASVQAIFAIKQISSLGDYSQRIPFQFSPLHLAAYFGMDDLIRLMLTDWNATYSKDSMNQCPLTWAAWAGYDSVVKIFLDNGINADRRDAFGQTPISKAASRGHYKVVELLLNYGIDPNSRDIENQTPLIEASRRQHHNVVELLLSKGAAINAQDDDWKTPLIWASQYGSVKIVRTLLENSAGLEYKDRQGKTAFSHATEGGHAAVIDLLHSAAGCESKGIPRTPILRRTEYSCPLCKMFSSYSFGSFLRHVQTRHFPKKRFVCHCGQRMHRQDKFVEHNVSHHRKRLTREEIKRQEETIHCPPRCVICQATTDSWASFEKCLIGHSTRVCDPHDHRLDAES